LIHTGDDAGGKNSDGDDDEAIKFGRLYKKNGSWKFDVSGIGDRADLSFFLEKYYNLQL
jgi:tellurium resistance protein TerD